MRTTARFAPLLLLPLALGACQLQPGFEDGLTETYSCGPHWVVAYNPSKTIRAQLHVETGAESLQEEWDMEEVEGDFAEDMATFDVYVGSCLNIPGCSDVSGATFNQVLHHHYEASAGRAEVEVREDNTIKTTIIDAVLEGTEGEESITLDVPWCRQAGPVRPSPRGRTTMTRLPALVLLVAITLAVGCRPEPPEIPESWEDAEYVDSFRVEELGPTNFGHPALGTMTIAANLVRLEVAYVDSFPCGQRIEAFKLVGNGQVDLLVQPRDLHPDVISGSNCIMDMKILVTGLADATWDVALYRRDSDAVDEEMEVRLVDYGEVVIQAP